MSVAYEEDVYEDEIPEVFDKEHLASLVVIAKMCLEEFFKGKEMCYGGAVTKASLSSPLAIRRLFEISIINGVDKAYNSMYAAGKGRKINKNGISIANQLILDVLKSCAKMRIPKRFRAGILLLYLELCHGIRII